jgi:hypothetical protein
LALQGVDHFKRPPKQDIYKQEIFYNGEKVDISQITEIMGWTHILASRVLAQYNVKGPLGMIEVRQYTKDEALEVKRQRIIQAVAKTKKFTRVPYEPAGYGPYTVIMDGKIITKAQASTFLGCTIPRVNQLLRGAKVLYKGSVIEYGKERTLAPYIGRDAVYHKIRYYLAHGGAEFVLYRHVDLENVKAKYKEMETWPTGWENHPLMDKVKEAEIGKAQ